jgi:hypothetical protein
LKAGWAVGEAEQQPVELIMPRWKGETRAFLVFFFYGDLPESDITV